jgi:subtilisin-like proprotein convertase family protein
VSSPNLAIPDAVVSGVTNTLSVTDTIPVIGSGITQIEFVEISFSAADHTYSGDLEITLTSPAGTNSILAETHDCAGGSCTRYSGWVFGSTNFLGESADGNWVLTVRDNAPVDTGHFQSWGLKFYGN